MVDFGTGAEAIIDQKAYVHHYIIRGCMDPWGDAYTQGQMRVIGYGNGCPPDNTGSLTGWAPGQNPMFMAAPEAADNITGIAAFSTGPTSNFSVPF